jgi:hypothetical protein
LSLQLLASRFIAEESTRAFELVIARSKTVEGATVKEECHFRIERLYYEEKVPDIIQSKAKADLGSQHAATFVARPLIASWKAEYRTLKISLPNLPRLANLVSLVS